MVIAYLRGRRQDVSISDQQSYILEYAKNTGISIDKTEIDIASYSMPLEDREEFLKLLKSLKEDDMILVYDIYSLSKKVGELVKIFDCIVKHKIKLNLCNDGIIIDNTSSASFILDLLSKTREINLQNKNSSVGRPKGSFSKSKFDTYRQKIVSMLSKGYNVSTIAKELSVSRSSLKDYINSRSLKDIAKLEDLPIKNMESSVNNIYADGTKCPLTNS